MYAGWLIPFSTPAVYHHATMLLQGELWLIWKQPVGEWMVGRRVRKMGGMACGSTRINIACSADRYQHSNTRWHSDWADNVSFIHVVFLLPSSPCIIQSTSTSTVFSLCSYSLHLDSQRPPSFTRTCTRKSKQSTTTSIHAHCSTSLAPPDHVVTSPCSAHTQQQQFSE